MKEKISKQKDNTNSWHLFSEKLPELYKGIIINKNGVISKSRAYKHYNKLLIEIGSDDNYIEGIPPTQFDSNVTWCYEE